MKLHCIKCNTPYETDDPDPYYCPDCLEAKRAIAAEIDRKFAGRDTTPPMTPLQIYEQARGQGKFANGKQFLS